MTNKTHITNIFVVLNLLGFFFFIKLANQWLATTWHFHIPLLVQVLTRPRETSIWLITVFVDIILCQQILNKTLSVNKNGQTCPVYAKIELGPELRNRLWSLQFLRSFSVACTGSVTWVCLQLIYANDPVNVRPISLLKFWSVQIFVYFHCPNILISFVPSMWKSYCLSGERNRAIYIKI